MRRPRFDEYNLTPAYIAIGVGLALLRHRHLHGHEAINLILGAATIALLAAGPRTLTWLITRADAHLYAFPNLTHLEET